ncbi:MAG: hypothetical protein J7L46_06900 [Bacteroidales bacterium]|nr:hypothetical protein [Bacteroidales bacterium]
MKKYNSNNGQKWILPQQSKLKMEGRIPYPPEMIRIPKLISGEVRIKY